MSENRYPGTTTRALNMGSYNYLGFAENSGPNVDRVEDIIDDYGVGVSSTRNEIGLFERIRVKVCQTTYLKQFFRHNSYS